MASPQSTTSHEDQSKKNLEQITFRFCAECSNMLYPKEDEDAHKLQFTCRTCQYTEEAASTCVFRNVLNNASGETAGVTQDVGSDPTVGAALASASASASAPAPAYASHPLASPPAPASHPLASPAFPMIAPLNPLQAVVLCFCCGDVVACHCCGTQLYAHSSPTNELSRDNVSDSAYGSDGHHTATDTDFDDDADQTMLDMIMCGDLSFLSDEYEFENGTEFGNRDESLTAVVS